MVRFVSSSTSLLPHSSHDSPTSRCPPGKPNLPIVIIYNIHDDDDDDDDDTIMIAATDSTSSANHTEAMP